MVSKNRLLNVLSPYNSQKRLLVAEQSTGDIIQSILEAHEKYKNEYKKIGYFFRGDDNEETGKNIFDFIKKNVPYVIESEDRQLVKSPAAILHTQADCKCYSLFIGGIAQALNIPFCFRFASYKPNQKNPGHVFIVFHPGTSNEIWVDPVLNYFDYKKQYCYAIDKKPRKMAIYSISGIGATKATKKEKKKVILKKITKGLGKGTKGVLKVAAAPARNAFLGLVRLNVSGLATKIMKVWAKNPSKLTNFWNGIGGQINKLLDTAKKGASKKRILGFEEGGMIGFAIPAALTAASPILAKFAALLKSVGINPEDLVDVAKMAIKKKAEEVLIKQEAPVIKQEQEYQNQAVESFG